MLLALIVLGGFSLLAMYAFDESEDRGPSLTKQLAQGTKQIASLEARVETAQADLDATQAFAKHHRELSALEVRLRFAKNRHAELETDQASAKQELGDTQATFADYKRRYRESARASLVGKQYESLVTQDGEVFEDVKVSKIDPARMQVRHKSGITGIKLSELPDELQEFLQLDEEETAQHLAGEKERSSNYNQRVDETDHKIRIAKMNERLRVLAEEEAQAERQIAKNTAAIDSYRNRIDVQREALAADRLRSQSGGVSKAPQIEGHIHNLEAQLRKMEQSIPKLNNFLRAKAAEAVKIRKQIAEAEREYAKKAAEAAKKGQS